MVGLVGADGLVVVDTGDAILVVPVERAQQVKLLVDQLLAAGRQDLV